MPKNLPNSYAQRDVVVSLRPQIWSNILKACCGSGSGIWCLFESWIRNR
jgi:hypothetical protein